MDGDAWPEIGEVVAVSANLKKRRREKPQRHRGTEAKLFAKR
jgi:hypothetical protein